jgi:tRNA modification GTPase
MFHGETSTIAALSTARGASALAVVRVTGPDAIAVAQRCFSNRKLADAASHTAHVGYVVDGEGRRLDQAVATLFRAPNSATGQDTVEFSCHGGDVAPQLVLRALLDAGAEPAEAGAFTRRAFLNGKLDLAQAEAVAALIHASSRAAGRVALHQLDGRYSETLAALRAELVQTAALVELELDFSEEDVAFADLDQLRALLQRTDALISELLDSARLGALVREGVQVVIAGRPNAGKSTLLNALVGRDRAIVSDTPGTTRDAIDAETEIGGLRFVFSDTAGLRTTDDQIEAEGVRRARHAISGADVLLYVFDATLGLDGEEEADLAALREDRPELPILLVANKSDLPAAPRATPDALALSAAAARSDVRQLADLREALLAAADADPARLDASPVVVHERHRRHLERAADAVARARQSIDHGADGALLALDLRAALDEIGAITGEVTRDDVLGAIFSQFCIGK